MNHENTQHTVNIQNIGISEIIALIKLLKLNCVVLSEDMTNTLTRLLLQEQPDLSLNCSFGIYLNCLHRKQIKDLCVTTE